MSEEVTDTALQVLIGLLSETIAWVRALDEQSGSTIEKLADAMRQQAELSQHLADRIRMLELDRQQGQS
jgi:hypothetical protein